MDELTVTVEVAVPPAVAMAPGVVAVTVKSPPPVAAVTVMLTTVVCVMPPEVPVTVTAYAPAVVVAVVAAVKVAVTALALVTLTDVGLVVQVKGLLAPAGLVVTTQLRLTAPIKPPDGVTLIVDVLPELEPAEKLSAPLLLSK